MRINATFANMVERNLLFFDEIAEHLDETSYDTLDSYRDNLYRAINFGGQTADQNLTAALLVLRCTQYIEQRCNYRHWAKLLTRVANRFVADDPVTFAKLLSMTGYFRFEAGQLDRAERAYLSAERIALRSEDELAVATASYHLAIMHYQRYEITQAKAFAERAINCVRDSTHCDEGQKLYGYLLNLMALLKMSLGEFSEAEEDLTVATELLAKQQSAYHIHLVRYNLAKLRIHQSRFQDAERLLKEELSYTLAHDLPASHAQTITRLTYLYIRQKKWRLALKTCRHLDIVDLQKRGHLTEIAMAKNNLGFISLHLNRLEQAKSYLLEAVAAWETLQNPIELANSLASLAAVQLAQKAFEASRISCRQALQHLDQSAQESIRSTEVREEIAEILEKIAESSRID